MSVTILPNTAYRYVARKSTVSKNVHNNSSRNVTSSTSSIFPVDDSLQHDHQIQCDIQLEENIQHECKTTLLLLLDNEFEQTITDDTDVIVIKNILEQILSNLSYENDLNPQLNMSTNIQDTMDSILNRLDLSSSETNNHNQQDEPMSVLDDVEMQDATRPLDEQIPMNTNQRSSVDLPSRVYNEVVEVEALASNSHSHSCTCQCHQTVPITFPTDEYLLFEQALKKTRQETELQQSLKNNRLLQTLKQQHQELIDFYQKQMTVNKTDREQQTNQINQQDSQMQTDLLLTTTAATTTAVTNDCGRQPLLYTSGQNSAVNVKSSPAFNPRSFATFLRPIRTTGPSLQQVIPSLTVANNATATLPSKPKLIAMKKVPSILSTAAPPSTVAKPSNSDDIVDLTQDEEDLGNKVPTEKTTTITQEQNTTPLLSSSIMNIRNQLMNLSPWSNANTLAAQTFCLRPLPEQQSFESSIPQPHLSIAYDAMTVRLTWNLPGMQMESILHYEIYAHKQSALVPSSDWRKIGIVKSMLLPMIVTLKEFQPNTYYGFTVRAVSIDNKIGPFCEPKTIFTGNIPTTSLPTAHKLRVP